MRCVRGIKKKEISIGFSKTNRDILSGNAKERRGSFFVDYHHDNSTNFIDKFTRLGKEIKRGEKRSKHRKGDQNNSEDHLTLVF